MSSMLSVAVPPRVWDWVLKIGDRDRLSSALSRDIERWKIGRNAPTMADIDTVSTRLRVPFGYFFLQNPIDDTPAVFAHRTLGSEDSMKTPSRDLVDTVNDMAALQDWARQDQIDAGEEVLPFVASMTLHSTVPQIVGSIREVLALSEDWFDEGNLHSAKDAFDFLRKRAERAKIIVMMNGVVGENTHRKLDPDEFRAFALIDEYAPLVFINRADEPDAARLFSLVHELVHIWLGADELFNDKAVPHAVSETERLCNAAATEILMPDSVFVQEWKNGGVDLDTEARVKVVCGRFPVSSSAVLLRALNHRLVTQQQYEQGVEKAREWADGERPKPSGGDYYLTKRSRYDRRLLDHIATSVAEGRTSYLDAYRLTRTNRNTFPKLLEMLAS
ncbi:MULTISPECIES: ImmA/IrrE family metallo-endopeptidase [Bifidobacterium]|jgi:Zn-dependent peptidase ImmA (M78 family)|uniref:ImmA/IrrE family metallo-endopeptidase n=1 Tax=Bifidobacterium TaxID=1678 RepID=UPI002356AB8E|nr:ImmA/IrrE family metallo-endopeptidase [Bifidobacterium tibiigranuli]MCI1212381.1 ImmA/IrrE family metallo-endopeptidase [Bifidobacterium tibiigranuli]MCI1222322.1 ImmA/IrrE family metallo-endopeptidase [Bifidobacterium tibiigranuli]